MANVYLRDVEERDLEIFFEQQCDEITKYMSAFPMKDPEEWDAFIVH